MRAKGQGNCLLDTCTYAYTNQLYAPLANL